MVGRVDHVERMVDEAGGAMDDIAVRPARLTPQSVSLMTLDGSRSVLRSNNRAFAEHVSG